MKSNILLVAQGASPAHSVVADAAVEAGRGLRHASNGHEAFEILAEGLDNIDVVIIDADPGTHSLSILDAISYRKAAPRIIVVTEFEEKDMASMAYRHGASACIARPFTKLELAALVRDVCLPDWQRSGGACDLWGHPESGKKRTPPKADGYGHVHDMTL